MHAKIRTALLATSLLILAACAKAPQAANENAAPGFAAAPATRTVDAGDADSPVPSAAHAFAKLPDHGELLAYPGDVVRRDGAYTWHRTDLSETHALHAIANGRLRVTAPSGEQIDFVYDRHVEHPSGDWTWIGHVAEHPDQQAILTFGAHAAFGTIAQPGTLPLRLTVRDGVSWLVETDPRKISGIVNAATRPQRPDYFIPPKVSSTTTSGMSMAGAQTMATAVAASKPTVDLVIGYTQAFANVHNGYSGAVTRLNYMVDVTNAAYVNSAINAQVRLLATILVNYPDNTSNDTTLQQLTGCGNADCSTRTAPNAAFNALRAAREQYGADLVSMVRQFNDPENGGCGIAWLIGGGQQGISVTDSDFGYSVVSDGTDVGTDGKSYYCLDETLAHELGHNMGANHDVVTAEGSDGRLDPGDYGAYPYSFGYKTGASTGNFYTIMAYGDTGQTIYRIFSDPRSTFCGGRACGTTTQADNARTLSQTIPTVAQFRATVVPMAGPARYDFDGDGSSDVLWRNGSDGRNSIWQSANSATSQAVLTVANFDWGIVGVADFDGDGKADILWRNARDGRNSIWRSANSGTPMTLTTINNLDWRVAGVGDFDGDGKADILWRNYRDGRDTIWKSANSATPQAVTTAGDLDWVVADIGDFDGDGKADILWRNARDGRNSIWRSANSATPVTLATINNLDWRVAGVGDFDGDGKTDILWRNYRDGRDTIWKSANSATPQAVTTAGDLGWIVASIGDFDGDGSDDILWRNGRDGRNSIWKSANSSTPQAVTTINNLAWLVVR